MAIKTYEEAIQNAIQMGEEDRRNQPTEAKILPTARINKDGTVEFINHPGQFIPIKPYKKQD